MISLSLLERLENPSVLSKLFLQQGVGQRKTFFYFIYEFATKYSSIFLLLWKEYGDLLKVVLQADTKTIFADSRTSG